MRSADPRSGHERAERVAAKSHDHSRVEDLELTLEVWRTGLDLERLGIPISGWPTLDNVGDEYLLALPADGFEQLVEQPTGGADERPALLVLVVARAFADEHDFRLRVALTRYRPGARLVERALRARSDLGGDLIECLPSLIGSHADKPAHSGACD